LSEASTPKENAHSDELLMRPPNQLQDLPTEFRWEATRRHPYYIIFWSDVLRYRQQQDQSENPAEVLLQYAASMMLGIIGIHSEPVDPSTSFKELDGDDDLDPAFLSGAVQPMTFRSMATAMINALPRAELMGLGAHFINAADEEYAIDGDGATGSLQRMLATLRLTQLSSPSLDSYPDSPLFYIHMGASQRTIVRDLEEQIRRWKQKRGITERRVHTGKLAKYLEIWDMREGWTGDGYDRTREEMLIEIAKQLKIPLSTVASRYRSAFKMITGHEFCPALWYRLLAPLKLSEVFNDPAQILSAPMRRRITSPIRRPVPETTLDSQVRGPGDVGTIEAESMICDDLRLTDFKIDLEELQERGLLEHEIAERLDCSVDTIKYVQNRFNEFGESH